MRNHCGRTLDIRPDRQHGRRYGRERRPHGIRGPALQRQSVDPLHGTPAPGAPRGRRGGRLHRGRAVVALGRLPDPREVRTRRPENGDRDRRCPADRAELLRRTAARSGPGRPLPPRGGVREVPGQHRRGRRLRRVAGLHGAQRPVRQPRRRRGPGRAGRARAGEPGPRGPGRRPDRRAPARRDPQRAGVAGLSAGERRGGHRRRRQGQRGDRPRQHQVPHGPLPPRHERRGPAAGDRRLRRPDRACADRRQPRARRTGDRRAPLEELLDQLAEAGYAGWVGLEYKPGDRPSARAFDWLPAVARAAR